MKNAVENVAKQVLSDKIIVLVDGCCNIPDLKFNQQSVIKGDANSAAIAAASILAKVERDRYMIRLDKIHPQYSRKRFHLQNG